METPLYALTGLHSLRTLPHPSVLIVESDPLFRVSLPHRLQSAMPDIVIEVCASRDDGISKVNAGSYHTVISDAHLAESDDFSLLKAAQRLACPVPFLVSTKGNDDVPSLAGLIKRGAFDILQCSSQGTEPSGVLRPALWLYELRLTMYRRRQRLMNFRRRHNDPQVIKSERRSEILRRTIHDIEETNVLCERTIAQIESSLRILEDVSHKLEARAMECAMRTVRLLESGASAAKA